MTLLKLIVLLMLFLMAAFAIDMQFRERQNQLNKFEKELYNLQEDIYSQGEGHDD